MNLNEALRLLGVQPPALVQDHRHCVDNLAAWKSGELKKAYRAQLRACHPDLGNQGDAVDLARRGEQTKRLNEAYEFVVKNLEVVRRRPQPQPMTIIIQGGTSATTTTSATVGAFDSFSTFWWPPR